MDFQYERAIELLKLTDKDFEEMFIEDIIEDRFEAGLGDPDDHPKYKSAMMLIDHVDEQLFYLSLAHRINDSVDYAYRTFDEKRDNGESLLEINLLCKNLTRLKYKIDKKLREISTNFDDLDKQYHFEYDSEISSEQETVTSNKELFDLEAKVEHQSRIEELLSQELEPLTESGIIESKGGKLYLLKCQPKKEATKTSLARVFYFLEKEGLINFKVKKNYYNTLSKLLFNDNTQSFLKLRDRVNRNAIRPNPLCD